MARVFAWVAVSEALLLCGAVALGLLAYDDVTRIQHVALAVFALLWVCLIHAGVFTYFTVTGKLIRQALALGASGWPVAGARGSDRPTTMTRVKAFKKRVTQLLGLSFATVVATVATGGWSLGSDTPGRWHFVAATPMVAVHLWVFFAYFNLITANARLLDETMEEYHRVRDARRHEGEIAPAPAANEPRTPQSGAIRPAT